MMEDLNVQTNSFVLFQLRGLQALGLWPLDSNNYFKLSCHYVYVSIFIVIIAILSISQIIQICLVTNIEEMSSTIDTATLLISGLYKILYYIIYHNHFKSLVRTVDLYFVEQSIGDNKFKMSDYLRNTKRYTQVYLVSVTVVVILWCTAPIIDMHYFPTRVMNTRIQNGLELNGTIILTNNKELKLESESEYKNNSETENMDDCQRIYKNKIQRDNICKNIEGRSKLENIQDVLIRKNRKFPLNCWFPFDTKWSPLYEVIFALEMSAFAFPAYAYIITDSFFFMVVYMVCGQLEIIKISLKNMWRLEKLLQKKFSYSEIGSSTQAETFSNSLIIQQAHKLNTTPENLELEKHMHSTLAFCIQQHNMILKLLKDLETLFRPLILIDILHAILSLSFAMLLTTISLTIVELFKCLTFVGICILHQYLNNYFGEIVIQQQLSICDYVYDTPWEDRSQAFKKNVLLMMTRTRNPVLLNGWKMYFLCLNTFKEFMSTLISYFMVLRQLQSDN